VIRTTCPYCGVGCGLRVAADGALSGDPDHPANHGRLCSKGAALADTLATDGRLLTPQIGGRNASWDEALDLIAGTFKQTIADHGPDAVARRGDRDVPVDPGDDRQHHQGEDAGPGDVALPEPPAVHELVRDPRRERHPATERGPRHMRDHPENRVADPADQKPPARQTTPSLGAALP